MYARPRCRCVMPAIIATVLQCAFSLSVSSAESAIPLITIEQLCRMERSEIAKRSLVRIRGTVTFVKKEWGQLCIQDEDHAINVFMAIDSDLKPGQLVELTGKTAFGRLKSSLLSSKVEVIGQGTMPEPVQLNGSKAFSLDVLYNWSEVEGEIYSAYLGNDRYYLSIAGSEFGMRISLPKSSTLAPISELKSSRIRVRGVPSFSKRDSPDAWRLNLLAPSDAVISVTPSTVKPGQPRIRKIVAIRRKDMRGPVEAPVRIRAVVRAVSSGSRLYVSDESGSLVVEVSDRSRIEKLKPGDVVEVEGPANRSLQVAFIENATVEYIGKGYSQPPTPTALNEAKEHLAELIEVEGMVVAGNSRENWLLLRSDSTFFRARYSNEDKKQLDHLAVGSHLRVAGGCWISPTDDAEFEISIQSAEILFEIPLETRTTSTISEESETVAIPARGESPTAARHSPPPPPWLPIVLLFLIFLCGVIWLLLRRLKAQERFQGSIHEQLSDLSHIARLNTLSEMVGALAHELNQPLASVSNYAAAAELLTKNGSAEQERLAGVVSSIGQEAFRAGEIIRRLRTLVRRKTPGSHPADVSEIITESIELFKIQQVTASKLVSTDCPPDLPPVMADTVQIQQVLLNLLFNARDATVNLSDRPPSISIEASQANGMVHISVTDNGTGIASPNPSSVFEPYFTTRESGTGLGLAISRAIIESHNGYIKAENAVPHGATITFSLPLARTKP